MEKVCYRRPEYLYGKRCPTAPEQPSSFGPRYPQNPVKLGTIGEIPELVSGHTSVTAGYGRLTSVLATYTSQLDQVGVLKKA